MTDTILLLILIILWLDFYIKHDKLIKKLFKKAEKKVIKKPDVFHIRKTWYWDKAIEDLEKITN